MKKLFSLFLLFGSLASAQTMMVPIVTTVINGLPPATSPTFSPGAGTYGGTQTVTISSTSGGAIICYNTTGSPATNGTTGCTTGTLYTGTVSVATSETLYAVAGGTGFHDSSVASAAYTIVAVPTVLQSNFSAADCTSTNCTTTLVNHASGGLTCVLSEAANSNPPTSISNTAGFTWTLETSIASSALTQYLSVWCATTNSYTGTDTFTVARATPTYHGGIVVYDIGNVSAVNTFNSASCSTSCTVIPSLALSPTGPYDMVLSLFGAVASTGWTAGSGYTCTTCGGSAAPWQSTNRQALSAYQQTSGTSVTANLAATHTEWVGLAVALQ